MLKGIKISLFKHISALKIKIDAMDVLLWMIMITTMVIMIMTALSFENIDRKKSLEQINMLQRTDVQPTDRSYLDSKDKRNKKLDIMIHHSKYDESLPNT